MLQISVRVTWDCSFGKSFGGLLVIATLFTVGMRRSLWRISFDNKKEL